MSSQEDKIKKLAIIGKRYLKGELRCPDCNRPATPAGVKVNAETQTVPAESVAHPSSKDQDYLAGFFEPPDPTVEIMFPKHLVYQMKEYSLEELKAMAFTTKVTVQEKEAKVEEIPLGNETAGPSKVEESIQKSMTASDRKDEEVSSVSAQSITKNVLNLVQDMWASPCSSEPRPQETVAQKRTIPFPIYDENAENCQPQQGAAAMEPPSAPVVRPPVPKFDVYTDNSMRKDGFYSERKAPVDRLVPQLRATVLSERKNANPKLEVESHPKSGVRKSLHFQETGKEENIPSGSTAPIMPPVPQNPVNMLDDSCSTVNFAFVLPSSTPVTKKRQSERRNELKEASMAEKSERTVQHLSVIAEASHERCSSSSGSQGSVVHLPVTPAAIGVDSTLMEDIDPFCVQLKENFLSALKFNEENAKNPDYVILSSKLPPMNKKIKLGSQMYSVLGEIGKGAFGRVMRARMPDDSEVSLKLEKPPCRWELYISQTIQKRVEQSVKSGFLNFNRAFIFTDGSILVAELAELGTLLNAANQYKIIHNQPMGSPLTLHFALEMFTIVDHLHRSKIIHADVKPDNFVMRSLPQQSEKVPCLVLIDFGRSIDMTLFPPNTTFKKVVTTDGFTCNEMKENKPWTYHTDLYGLAGSLNVILTSEYMTNNVKKNGRWKLAKTLPRTCNRDVWDPIFDSLLNHDSFQPIDLKTMINPVKEAYDKLSDSTKKVCFSKLAQAIIPK